MKIKIPDTIQNTKQIYFLPKLNCEGKLLKLSQKSRQKVQGNVKLRMGIGHQFRDTTNNNLLTLFNFVVQFYIYFQLYRKRFYMSFKTL